MINQPELTCDEFALEQLESRQLLSISAFMDGPTLRVLGDSDSNHVAIYTEESQTLVESETKIVGGEYDEQERAYIKRFNGLPKNFLIRLGGGSSDVLNLKTSGRSGGFIRVLSDGRDTLLLEAKGKHTVQVVTPRGIIDFVGNTLTAYGNNRRNSFKFYETVSETVLHGFMHEKRNDRLSIKNKFARNFVARLGDANDKLEFSQVGSAVNRTRGGDIKVFAGLGNDDLRIRAFNKTDIHIDAGSHNGWSIRGADDDYVVFTGSGNRDVTIKTGDGADEIGVIRSYRNSARSLSVKTGFAADAVRLTGQYRESVYVDLGFRETERDIQFKAPEKLAFVDLKTNDLVVNGTEFRRNIVGFDTGRVGVLQINLGRKHDLVGVNEFDFIDTGLRYLANGRALFVDLGSGNDTLMTFGSKIRNKGGEIDAGGGYDTVGYEAVSAKKRPREISVEKRKFEFSFLQNMATKWLAGIAERR